MKKSRFSLPNPRSLVGDDIVTALAAVGSIPIAMEAITALPSPRSKRAAFRVILADGRTVKARRMKGVVEARRYTRLLRAASHHRLPAILAASGEVLIEEWVEGSSLFDLRLSRQRLEQAADILGSLHATPSLDGRPLLRSLSTAALVRRVERQLESVERRGAITRAERRRLLELFHAHLPQRAVVGLTHNDFCAENLIEDPAGRLYSIDNERMKLGFLEFDLARTWYRWALADRDWSRFLRRYQTWSAPPISKTAPFWQIAAVAKSAHLRAGGRAPNVEVPVRKLREIMRAAKKPR